MVRGPGWMAESEKAGLSPEDLEFPEVKFITSKKNQL